MWRNSKFKSIWLELIYLLRRTQDACNIFPARISELTELSNPPLQISLVASKGCTVIFFWSVIKNVGVPHIYGSCIHIFTYWWPTNPPIVQITYLCRTAALSHCLSLDCLQTLTGNNKNPQEAGWRAENKVRGSFHLCHLPVSHVARHTQACACYMITLPSVMARAILGTVNPVCSWGARLGTHEALLEEGTEKIQSLNKKRGLYGELLIASVIMQKHFTWLYRSNTWCLLLLQYSRTPRKQRRKQISSICLHDN